MFKAIYAREGLRRPRGLLAGHMANGAVSQVGEESDTAAPPALPMPAVPCSQKSTLGQRREEKHARPGGPAKMLGWPGLLAPVPTSPEGPLREHPVT